MDADAVVAQGGRNNCGTATIAFPCKQKQTPICNRSVPVYSIILRSRNWIEDGTERLRSSVNGLERPKALWKFRVDIL